MAAIFQRVPWRSLKPTNSGPKPIENARYPHPAQARDQEMPELVEKHDKAENEQKGDKIADDASPKRMQMRQ